MKLLLAVATALVATQAVATEATIKDHYKTVEFKTPYTVRVCEKKPTVQGAAEGAVIGGILGEILGGGEKTEGLAIFGAIVGANESQYQTVCRNETRYNTNYKQVYSHSTITFIYEGREITVEFNPE